jgi:hypothetical protein
VTIHDFHIRGSVRRSAGNFFMTSLTHRTCDTLTNVQKSESAQLFVVTSNMHSEIQQPIQRMSGQYHVIMYIYPTELAPKNGRSFN